MTGDGPGLDSGVTHQTLAQNIADRVQNGHRIAAPEGARHRRHPGGQQAFAGQQRLDRPGVQPQLAARLHRVDPAFARGLRVALRHEPGAGRPLGQCRQRTQHRAFHDRHGAAPRHGGLGRQKLGLHAALGQARDRIARHRLDLRRNRLDQVETLGFGVQFGIGRIKAVDIGQQDQLIGPDRHGDLGRQPVVVAEPDLIRCHGVVFVDDGHHTQTKQGFHGGAAVQIAPAVLGILQRHQNLGRGDAMGGQHLFIGAREPYLADSRRRLRLFKR